jgi:hypothetical protein
MLPGLGQIYAGNYSDGLNAFTLNMGTGYLVINSLFEERYLDVLIVYLPLFYRYYDGNRYNAEKEVLDYNTEQNVALENRVMRIFESTISPSEIVQ